MEKKLNISEFRPCERGARYYDSFPSFGAFWAACDRGDWMLWLAARLGVDNKLLARAAALCANTVRGLMRDERSTAAVDAALKYADGELSREALEKYADAAIDAFNAAAYADTYADADTAAAGAATWADAYAAYAWYAATDAAAAAAADANAASAAADAARAANMRQTADICREALTEAVMQAAESFGRKYNA